MGEGEREVEAHDEAGVLARQRLEMLNHAGARPSAGDGDDRSGRDLSRPDVATLPGRLGPARPVDRDDALGGSRPRRL